MTYNLFGNGLFGSFMGMAYFVAIALASTIPYVDKPLHKTLELIVPVYLIGFVMNVINLPSIVTGLVVISVYLISMKSTMKINTKTWFSIVFSFVGILIIFSFVPLSLSNYMFAFLIAYIFVQGKMTMFQLNKELNLSTVFA